MILKALEIVSLSECKALEFWCCGLGVMPLQLKCGRGWIDAKCPARNRLTRTPVLAEN